MIKCSFKGWSTNLCSVKIDYKPDKDKCYFIKVRSVRQKMDNGKPHFSKKQIETIKLKVKWNYGKFVLNNHHLEDKCERCIFNWVTIIRMV